MQVSTKNVQHSADPAFGPNSLSTESTKNVKNSQITFKVFKKLINVEIPLISLRIVNCFMLLHKLLKVFLAPLLGTINQVLHFLVA